MTNHHDELDLIAQSSAIDARALMGAMLDEFPREVLAAIALNWCCRDALGATDALIGEWAILYANGRIAQPLPPKLFARYAEDVYRCGCADGGP